MDKKKILELCEFSSGVCGVWNRVLQESKLLSKDYSVFVFSSNLVKGTNKIAPEREEIDGITIKRFPVKFKIGENALFWDFEEEAIKLSPDIIIAHVYRHPHTNSALKIAKKIEKIKNKKIKVILVTHAPFVEKKLRGFKLNFFVKMYDFLYKKNLNKYDKVVVITKWEIPYLLKLGCKKEKIVYIPNGIPDKFFEKPIKKFESKRIIFFGRIAPIKNIETILKASKILSEKGKKFNLKLIGPAEEEYEKKLKIMINSLRITNVKFVKPVYELNKKIDILNKTDIFVLPSIREAMPQSLIEAMALGRIVISSDTQGAKEIIKEGKNGFLFRINDEKGLAEKILFCMDKRNFNRINRVSNEARKSAENFKWSKLIIDLKRIL